jgi:hypothetical protein
MTSSIFDKTPLPYVPETCSEWQLKRDIIKYNLRSYVSWKSVAAIFGHTKGIGWFMLPEKWYRKPRELYEMTKIGLYLVTNIVIISLPLKVSEFIMTTLNPAMKKRQRVPNYKVEDYKTCDWDEDETKNLMLRLKKAREERKATGKFNVFVDEEEQMPETATASLVIQTTATPAE